MKTLELVKNFNARPDVVKSHFLTDDTDIQINDVREAIESIVAAAEEELITESGRSNTLSVDHLIRCGVAITCGERDASGWLSGVIHTKHGRIVYG